MMIELHTTNCTLPQSVTSLRPDTLKKMTMAMMVVSVKMVESAAAVP